MSEDVPEPEPMRERRAILCGTRPSTHHLRKCDMCRDDATEHNHCSYCGMTFRSRQELIDHLEAARRAAYTRFIREENDHE